MKHFLKHNFLILLVLFFGYAAYALATTITRPYGASDYAGGQKAVGSKVNSEFDNIVNWLNGGNIATGNIAALGVATANIQNNAVTVAKMAAENQSVTGSSAAYLLNVALTPVGVTNLATTLTTNGRSVALYLESSGSTVFYSSSGLTRYDSYVLATINATPDRANLFFVSDSATVSNYSVIDGIQSSAPTAVQQPCSAFRAIIPAQAAGTHTYGVNVSKTSALDTLQVVNCRLVVRELY